MSKRLFPHISFPKVRQTALALAFAVAAMVAYFIAPLPTRGVWLSLLATAANLNAALAAYYMLTERGERDRGAIRLLTVSFGLWSLAASFQVMGWLGLEVARARPGLQDLPLVAGYAAFLTAIPSFPASRLGRFGNIRNLLEVLLVTLAAAGVAWFSFVRPVVQVRLPGMLQITWVVLYLVMDIAALALSVRMAVVSGAGPNRRLFLGLFGGVLFLAAGDAWNVSQVLLASAPSEFVGEATAILAASVMTLALLAAGREKDQPGYRMKSDWLKRAESLIPVIGVSLVLGLTVVDWWLMGDLDWIGLILAACLGLLLVARQGVIAGQSEMRQYATLVQGAADLAFVCDAQGELLLTNPALESAVGQGRAAPTNLGEFLQGPLSANSLLEQALDRGWSGEVEFKAADGALMPVALSLRPVVDERRAEPVLAGTAHDLTKLKRRERDLRRALHEVDEAREELQQLNLSLEAKVEARTQELEQSVRRLEKVNEELKELDRLKSEFVTLVSHELRAPLTNIRSGVELLLKDPDELSESVEETLDLVSNETERLVDFVEIILDLSALEAGRFPLEFEPLDMAPLAGVVATRFPAQSGGERIEIEIDGDLPPVRGDERAITSVLLHLVDNALKYAPEGPVWVRGQVHGDNVRIAVCDQGPGIPPAEREAVFDSFHRLDASDSRQVYGRGLGLYLSRRLVEAMGGRIEAAQSASGGAEVTFELPQYD